MTPTAQIPPPADTSTDRKPMTAQISAPTPAPTVRIPALDPIRDEARLAALRALDLIDSGPDETIDRFTRLAGELLQVPVCLPLLGCPYGQGYLFGRPARVEDMRLS
jgi:hypothetical protein